jgi:hypothetical protein
VSAYREAGEAPCHICGDLTQKTCDLCQRTTCVLHFVDGVQAAPTCRECVKGYQRYMTEGDSMMPMGAMLLSALFLAMLIPIPWGVLVLPGPFVADHFRKKVVARMRRKKFFDIMRRRGALPEPDPIHSDHVESAKMIAKLEKQLRKKK